MDENMLKEEYNLTLTGEEILVITEAIAARQSMVMDEIKRTDSIFKKVALESSLDEYVCVTDVIAQKFADVMGVDLEEETNG